MELELYAKEMLGDKPPAKFGSDEMFQYIKGNVETPISSDWFIPVFYTIEKYSMYILSGKSLTKADKEDIANTVALKVYRRIEKFVDTSENMNEAQRTNWLKTIVIRVLNDRNKKKVVTMEDDDNIDEDDERADDKTYVSEVNLSDIVADIDEDKNFLNEDAESQKGFDRIYTREELIEHFAFVFSLDTSSDTIISFVYNCCFCELGLLERKHKSGIIADKLNGKLKKDIFKIIKKQLNKWFKLPDHVYFPFMKKINEEYCDIEKRTFNFTPDQIVEQSSWVREKVKKKNFK